MAERAYRFCPMCGGELHLAVPNHESVEQPVCTQCGYVFYLDPKVAAGTIPSIDGRLILLRRAIGPGLGKWVYPGGYVNRGERVEAAAERETHEEVNLRVHAGELVGIYSYSDAPIVVVVYEADHIQGVPQAGIEALEIRAFPPDQVPWKQLAFSSTRDALLDWMLRHYPQYAPREYTPFHVRQR